MSEVLKCPSCGGSNQLPTGRRSMFCAFCGNAIERRISEQNNPKISKSKISGGELAYKDRNILSLDEIVNLYSDSELDNIRQLDLSDNQISSLKNLRRFKASYINLSNNEISIIDELPKFSDLPLFTPEICTLNFENNSKLSGFSVKVIEDINDLLFCKINFNLVGCNNFNFESLKNLNETKIIQNRTGISISTSTEIKLPTYLKEKGFTNTIMPTILPNKNVNVWRLNDMPIEEFRLSYKPSEYKSGKCFIATATLGSYEHPQVMELRNFRDEWVLKKSWGEGFVNWYYRYGEVAAKFIEKSFILKKLSHLLIVKPLVYLSRIVKK